MNTTIVIYHRADFDGLFSCEIARRRFGEAAQYIGWDYGDPLPDLPADAAVFMIDISVEGRMDHPNLTWIDHHATAIAKHPSTIPGLRIDGVAACRLAWQWFFGNPTATKEAYVQRLLPEPLAVRLAGEYDVWDHRDPRAVLFQHGLRSRDLEPLWATLLSMSARASALVEELLKAGQVLHYARERENESVIKQQGFTVQWEGLTFLALNTARCNSLAFAKGLKPEHDGCLGFHWNGSKWRVSLYGVPGKPDVDLGAIAARHGGGGHKQACGFETEAPLPFLPAVAA
jgi:hypothetical protein